MDRGRHIHSNSLEESLNALKQLENTHLELGHEMQCADDGNMYGLDLLATGALNRAANLIASGTI